MAIVKYSDGSIGKIVKTKSDEEQEELNDKMSEAKEDKELNKEANTKNSNSPFWTK